MGTLREMESHNYPDYEVTSVGRETLCPLSLPSFPTFYANGVLALFWCMMVAQRLRLYFPVEGTVTHEHRLSGP